MAAIFSQQSDNLECAESFGTEMEGPSGNIGRNSGQSNDYYFLGFCQFSAEKWRFS
jgi:hypothetical protein